MTTQRANAIAILVALAGACQLLAALHQAGAGSPPVESGETRPRWAALFNFDQFRQRYSKHYSSLVESLARQRYFLARALRAFASAVGYKHMRRSHYLAVNTRSDWTPDELKASLMQPDEGQTAPAQLASDERMAALYQLEPGQLEVGLDYLQRHSNETGGVGELAGELRRLGARQPGVARSSRSRREHRAQNFRTNERRARGTRLDFDVLSVLSKPRARGESSPDATHTDLAPSNNPFYELVEAPTMGAADRRTEREFFEDPQYKAVHFSVSEAKAKRSLKWRLEGAQGAEVEVGAHLLAKILGGFVEGITGLFGPDEEEEEKGELRAESEGRGEQLLFVDHRDSKCFFEPQEQGQCGSCYAFASIAYLEWAFCRQMKVKLKFSEQYVVDCGPRTGGLYGCRSGKATTVADFFNNFGLELEQHYPYAALEQACPYAQEAPFESMGYMRIQLERVLRVPLDHIEHYLNETPMVVNLAVGEEFHQYGGGVDPGKHCGGRGLHSMLLIGHGRQEGREFWLLRNSYSADFGEAGYYKLDKAASLRCFEPAEGFVYGRDEHSDGPPQLFPKINTHVGRANRPRLVLAGAENPQLIAEAEARLAGRA